MQLLVSNWVKHIKPKPVTTLTDDKMLKRLLMIVRWLLHVNTFNDMLNELVRLTTLGQRE